MDNQQILEHLDNIWTYGHEPTDEEREAARDAIDAVQKQIPKKPVKVKESKIRYTDGYICPSCGGGFTGTGIAAYCCHCGQAIDWDN